jgi:hypothetical protein
MTDREINLAITDAERTLTFVGSATVLAHTAFDGLVMDAATLIAATAWRETLAANLAVAGALWAAHTGIDDPDGGGKWWPGMGRPAPGWER